MTTYVVSRAIRQTANRERELYRPNVSTEDRGIVANRLAGGGEHLQNNLFCVEWNVER